MHRIPLALLATAALGTSAANASDLLGFYVGAGAARTEVSGEVPPTSSSTGLAISESDTGWRAFAGIRALSLFGAELEYVDLGSASISTPSGSYVVDADLKATALYGVFYLPIPAPFVDIYAKAGYARLSGELRGSGTVVCLGPSTAPQCGPLTRSLDDNTVAAGAGVQVKLGSWALRGEYERFFASGSDPSVISLNVAKFFL